MLSFPKEYKNAAQVTIGGNYRCTEPVLKAAAALIGHNKKRYGKRLTACKGWGEPVHVTRYPDTLAQADDITEKIRTYAAQGIEWEEMAVLFRTARQMNLFSRKFMEYNIPFVMKDSVQNMFEHWVAKDLLTYVRMAQGGRSRADFLKVCNRPKRYLSRAALTQDPVTFGGLYEYYRDKPYMCERINAWQNDLFAMKQMTPYSAIDYIYNVIGYRDFLLEYGAERNVSTKDWEEIVEEIKEDASGFDTAEHWFAHIDEYGKQLEELHAAERSGGKTEKEHGLAMMTMHGSKGLEFEVVFVPDVNDGVVPYQKAVDEGNLEEERRLLYVAMTRAKEHLHLSYAARRFHKDAEPSRFLEEIRG
jgi:DNA helicase-2/ATP-dependent DNA helicase PcrA